jgi:hypothetical protein
MGVPFGLSRVLVGKPPLPYRIERTESRPCTAGGVEVMVLLVGTTRVVRSFIYPCQLRSARLKRRCKEMLTLRTASSSPSTWASNFWTYAFEGPLGRVSSTKVQVSPVAAHNTHSMIQCTVKMLTGENNLLTRLIGVCIGFCPSEHRQTFTFVLPTAIAGPSSSETHRHQSAVTRLLRSVLEAVRRIYARIGLKVNVLPTQICHDLRRHRSRCEHTGSKWYGPERLGACVDRQ